MATSFKSMISYRWLLTLAIAVFQLQTLWAAPSLTEEEVMKLGKVVLAARGNEEYKEVFWNDKPVYDPEKEIWAYRGGWARSPDGKFHTFEIRESDGDYRLGWNTPWKASAGVDKFRIQPSIRRKIRSLLGQFSEPVK